MLIVTALFTMVCLNALHVSIVCSLSKQAAHDMYILSIPYPLHLIIFSLHS